jgi:nitrite reductase/ring-hydroxylating ferredoxin subunit
MSFAAVDRATLGVEPSLELAATYNRVVRVSVDRIWENVFDWEHLPVLHDTYFNHVELLDIGAWGWRVVLTKQPGTADRRQLLELRVDRENTRYCVRTLDGAGTGTQIWTLLLPVEPQRTAIEVRYYLPEHRPEKVDMLGEKYRCSCQRLWDEDEAMMMRRELLAQRRPSVAKPAPLPPADAAPSVLALGPLRDLRPRLPLVVTVGDQPFRVVELEHGELAAHATICPHWLGPLDEVAPENGMVRCPWHGYLFDIRTGKSADGRGYALAPAPRVVVDPVTGEVLLIPASAA